MKGVIWAALVVIACLGCEGYSQSDNDNRNTRHVFPQFADGKLPDGSYFKSTLMLINADTQSTNNCNFALYGDLRPRVEDAFVHSSNADWSIDLGPGGWQMLTSTADGPLISGPATLICDHPVTAQVLFSFYNRTDVKLSEATVFSTPGGARLGFIADQRGGSRLALAFANSFVGYVRPSSYTIGAFAPDGTEIGTKSIPAPDSANLTVFVDEIIPATKGILTTLAIYGDDQRVYVIGLRFTGNAFTTMPPTIIVPSPSEPN